MGKEVRNSEVLAQSRSKWQRSRDRLCPQVCACGNIYMDVCMAIERLTLPPSAWGHRTAKEHPEGQQSDKGLCSIQLQQPQVRQLPTPVLCCKTCSPRCFLKNNPELSLSEALDSVPGAGYKYQQAI